MIAADTRDPAVKSWTAILEPPAAAPDPHPVERQPGQTIVLPGAPFSDVELSVSYGSAWLALGDESRPLSVSDRAELRAWLDDVDDALGVAL